MNYTGIRLLLLLFCGFTASSFAQHAPAKKYPSLLWEITGNGLKKPSYLFGTMHISNKMVFHLSDSFYNAIRRVDVVALELSPELWQNEIPRMDRQSEAYKEFVTPYSDDYLHQASFTAAPFLPKLKTALSTEPSLNNSLLYRTNQGRDDFEENTYLDLYIYQTGRKLGKSATGVEQYMQSQRMMVEAYVDAAAEQKKTVHHHTELSGAELSQAIQDAYRNGDLDMLDSIDKLTEQSAAYTEKFLYRRNDIQARSMDSIMRRQSLFVGVGAAHLPGKRGVIENLRSRGYHLRPVHMADRDAAQKEDIDTLRVPVTFTDQYAPDSLFRVAAPGPLHPLSGVATDRLDYADMANGAYYLVTRIKTHPFFNGDNEETVYRVVDSTLYENVPGRIISKKQIVQDGYKGFDIVNRTRRGDMQHYRIFVTPAEVIIFKMGGTENYVAGPEAERFFSSIQLKPRSHAPYRYQQAERGFGITFPSAPVVYDNPAADDNERRLELEATDAATGADYLLLRKDAYTFGFLEQDSFEANLGTESLLGGDYFDKEISRREATYKGYDAVDAVKTTKDKQYVYTRSVIQGPHRYLLAVRSKTKGDYNAFFNSLSFFTPAYGEILQVQDTFLKLAVKTPVALKMDADIGALIAYTREGTLKLTAGSAEYSSRARHRRATYYAPASGELVTVDVATWPQYYYARNRQRFWRGQINDATNDSDMVLRQKDSVTLDDGTTGYRLTISDTATSRTIHKLLLLKGQSLYTIATVTDSRQPESAFIQYFFATARPYGEAASPSLFDNKLSPFFADYYSHDSVTHTRAGNAIATVYFGKAGYPKIREAINRLHARDRDYTDLKVKFINELGYLDDSEISADVVRTLADIYQKASDTSVLQNAVLTALAHLKTGAATKLFRQLLVQDPPVFDESEDYEHIFSPYEDTLKLAATLFPDLLQLAQIEDYKPHIVSLLAMLADSGYVAPQVYESSLSHFIFDAKIALKKQTSEDEQSAREQAKDGDDADNEFSFLNRSGSLDTSAGTLYDYAVLLAPFYDRNAAVPHFFDRLMQAQRPELILRAALLLARYHKPVADTVWSRLAAAKSYRSRLYSVLRRAGKTSLFPAKYATQEQLVRSRVYEQVGHVASLEPVGKKLVTFKGKTGYVYLFKYRKKPDDDWKLALNGPQPADGKGYNADPALEQDGILYKNDQTDKAVKQALIGGRTGGRQFYTEESSAASFRRLMSGMRGGGE